MTRFISIITLIASLLTLAWATMQLLRAILHADMFIIILFTAIELISISFVTTSIRELRQQL